MKTTPSGYSQLVVSLGIMLVLLMLIGSSMAAPAQASTGQATGTQPSLSVIKQWIFANLIQLSQIVAKTQADFSQDRLGDAYYSGYIHRVPGLPDPTWNLCKMTEQKILKKTSEELYVIRKFIRAMKTHESQNKNSQFLAKFRQIEGRINSVLGYIGQMELALHYTVTQEPSAPLPARSPAATPKEQDKWELGVLKGIAWWIVPVQAEFHRHSS